MEEINDNDELQVTSNAAQLARKRYYNKIKNTDEYKLKRRLISHNQYHNTLKHNEEFKKKVSDQKKEYYIKNKTDRILDIIV